MSVKLYSRTHDFQKLADAYESIKPYLGPFWSGTDEQFYKALRRLYFANVATYLCQYHDSSPLSADELLGIDPFQELEGRLSLSRTPMECAHTFLSQWRGLQYNLTTNDGEIYVAKESYEFMDTLASYVCLVALERFAQKP